MKLLIVDDEKAIVKALLRELRGLDLDITFTSDSEEALEMLKKEVFDILLTDQRMPQVTGLDLIKYIQENNKNTIAIMMTGYSEFSVLVEAINSGRVFKYLAKPWEKEEFSKVMTEAINRKMSMEQEQKIIFKYFVEKKEWENMSTALNASITNQKQKTLKGLTDVIKIKDNELYTHSLRVAEIASEFARYIDLSTEKCRLIYDASMVHDFGKITIRDRIVMKKGLLEENEFIEMRKHAEVGEEILLGMAGLEDVSAVVGQHHERVDGLGYPKGLTNDEICVEAKIMSIVDIYDALISKRTYKSAITHGEALEMMNEMKDEQLDSKLVDKFAAFISAI
jgi:response regulator RpfG family c-di-GMP phosphodiesterase